MKAIYSALAVLLLGIDCQSIQAATPTRDQLELANLQFQGMKDSRERLTAGSFRGTGTDHRAANSDSPKRDTPLKFFCVFDYAANCFRFDRDLAQKVVIHQVQPDKRDFNVPGRAIYIRRPEYSLHWCNAESLDTVNRRRANADPSDAVAAFDVRCMGMAFNGTLDRYSLSIEALQGFSGYNVVEAVEETERVCRVVLQFKKHPDVFLTVWFDSAQGYSPIRIEVCLGAPSSLPFQRAETTWQHISGVWVPKTFLGEDYDFSGKVLERRMELAFEWESVNQPVAEKHFTAAEIGLRPETRIVSDELGKRIQVGTVGGTEFEKRGAGTRMRVALTIVSLLLLAIAIVVFLVRRARVRA